MTQIVNAGGEQRDSETFAVIGAAMAVHRILGAGFLESVYQSALEVEFLSRGIPHLREVAIPVFYRGTELDVKYRADFICFGRVLVELKAVHRITPIEEAQVIHYLIATKLNRGLLFNFGAPSLQFRRYVGPASVLDSSVSSVKSVVSMGRNP